MKKVILSIALISLSACSMDEMKTSAINTKNTFQTCAQEQALVMMLNPTTSSLSTSTMAKQVVSTCQTKITDSAITSSDQTTQIALAAISAAKLATASKTIN